MSLKIRIIIDAYIHLLSYSTITITSYDSSGPLAFRFDIHDYFVAETSITTETVRAMPQ